MMPSHANPSSGAPRHLLPQGEKEEKKAVPLVAPSEKEENRGDPLPSPLAGEGGSARSAMTEEGLAAVKTGRMTQAEFARDNAKRLCKDMTDVERILWSNLRGRRFEHFKFRRQVPIGKYNADFVCFERSVIVELDGSQHEGSTHDELRDAWLRSQGFRVVRFWNIDILQALDGTLRAIWDALNETRKS